MITIGILLFPDVEELDFVGPFEVLNYINKLRPDSTKVLLIAAAKAPLKAFNGLTILPDTTMDDCPYLDIVLVPGGKGRLDAMQDDKIKSFLIRQNETTQYTVSVCTGALVLAAAGLLNSRKATTYHTALPELPSFGIIPVADAKVVQDGKFITAAGVSSGLELGFYLLKLLFSADLAQEVADKIEYQIDIKNGFNNGSL